jgi:hypothetical protein
VARLRQTLDGRYGGPLTHRSYTTPWDTTQRLSELARTQAEIANGLPEVIEQRRETFGS